MINAILLPMEPHSPQASHFTPHKPTCMLALYKRIARAHIRTIRNRLAW